MPTNLEASLAVFNYCYSAHCSGKIPRFSHLVEDPGAYGVSMGDLAEAFDARPKAYRLDLDTLGEPVARADRLRHAVADHTLNADTIEEVAFLWGVDPDVLARAYRRLTDNRGNRPGRNPRARFEAFAAASEASDEIIADRHGFTVRAIRLWRQMFDIPTCAERRAALAAAPARATYPKPAWW